MSPKKLPTRKAGIPEARSRRQIAQKYLEVADVVAVEDGAAINVAVGLAVLAGIAAGDAICIAAIGERYSGSDHSAAAGLLSRVDAALGKQLRRIVDLKPGSHYGDRLLRTQDRTIALRAAALLVDAARERVP